MNSTLTTLQKTAKDAHMLARTIEMQIGILLEHRDTPTLRQARLEAVAKHSEEIIYLMQEVKELIDKVEQEKE